jgi:Catalase
VQLIEDSVRAEAKNAPARRDAHAKAHGCVKAEFRVLDNLPEALQVGIFAEANSYPAWIRYSNGSGKLQNDSVGDARGMAIKLMGVADSESGTQDFVMVNHPVFFVRDIDDYLDFQQSVANGNPRKFFFPGFNPFKFRLHELGIVKAIRNKKVANPLNTRYWSMTPYLFGHTVMKFSVRPSGELSGFVEMSSPNFLRDNMAKHLAQSEAHFDFSVQLRTQSTDMPIEDPTLEWDEQASPFIPVARITIKPQTFTSAEQLAFCESLSFTPWHNIPAYRPLGGINRMRKAVYDTISRLRHQLNGEERREPTGF